MKRERYFYSLRRTIHTLTILSLTLSLLFSSGVKPVAAQGEWIEASPTSHWVHARGWPSGTTLNLTLNGAGEFFETTAVIEPAPWNPDDIVADFIIPGDVDIAVGQEITVTDGTTSKSLTISPLKINQIDLDLDTISGTGTDGNQVQVCANVPDNCYSRFVTVAGGLWTAYYGTPGVPPDSTETFDVQMGSHGWAVERDADGDQTWVNWGTPNPRIDVQLTHHNVEAHEWLNDNLVTLTLTRSSGDTYSDTVVMGPAPWNPNEIVGRFNIPYEIAIEPGQSLSISGNTLLGPVTKTLIIPSLVVTDFNLNLDTISGTAEAGTQVQVCANVPGGCYNRFVTAGDGTWTVNYGMPGTAPDDSPEILDVQPGTDGWVGQYDADADWVSLNWSVPAPYIEVNTGSQWLHARGWLKDTPVTLNIVDGTSEIYTNTVSMAQASWNPGDPNDIVADFPIPAGIRIEAGQVITASGDTPYGPVTKELLVSPMAVTSFDKDLDTISGTGSNGSQVQVCANEPGYCYTRFVTVVGGTWTAYYGTPGVPPDSTETFDVQVSSNGWAAERDADGDQTWVDWRVPNPTLGVRPDSDQVEAWEWPLGAELTLTVNGGEPFTTIVGANNWDPNQTYAIFMLRGTLDIQSGDDLTLTDGVTTKHHTVTGLAITAKDTTHDVVSGSATDGTWVDLWACDQNHCVNRHVMAVGGQWSADFANPGPQSDEQETFDLTNGTGGDSTQRDEDGDQTMVGWNIANPRLNVSYEFDWIGADGFTPNGQITYWIYDEQGNLQFGPVTGPLDPYGNGWISSQLTHIDLAPGYRVVVQDADTLVEREVLVKTLLFERVDDLNDVVYGKADPGETVIVHIGGYGYNEQGKDAQATADSSGVWQANLAAIGYDVQNYWWASVDLCDEINNCVTAEAPKIHGSPRNNSFGLDNFSKNKDITLEVFSDPGGSLLLGPITLHTNRTGSAWINFSDYNFTLLVGHHVVVTDFAGWSKSLTIGPVTFDELNAETEMTSGTTEAGGQLSVHVNTLFNNWGDRLQADASGNWFYDFGARGYDLTTGMWGNIWLQDNNMDFTEDFITGAPSLTASTQYDWVNGNGFSPNAQVAIDVFSDGGERLGGGTYTTDNNTNLWIDSNNLGVDLEPGMRIAATDVISGHSTELILAYLTFETVDYDLETAAGRATAGARVVVQAGSQFENFELSVITNTEGIWLADFSAKGIDLNATMWLNARIFDASSNATQADAPQPATFAASAQNNWISGNNWPPDSDVTISITTSSVASEGLQSLRTFVVLADEYAEDTQTITVHTDQYGNFWVNLYDYGIQLEAGDTITVRDENGQQEKTETVISLSITEIDYNNDLVYGIAPAGTRVRVGFGNNHDYLEFDVFAGADNLWMANFGLHDFDLTTDMNGSVRVWDEDGDTTEANFNPPSFAVWYEEDYVEGWEWENGSEVTLTVDDPAAEGTEYTNTVIVSPPEWSSNPSARFYTNDPATHAEEDTIDIQPGFILTMSGGGYTKTHIVTTLKLDPDPVNMDEDTLSGTAEPGTQVHGWICNNTGCVNRITEVDGAGHWTLDFTGDYDFHTGGWGEVKQDDTDYDSTQLRWQANQPPTAEAGSDQTVDEGAEVLLDGSASSDPDGQPISYAWDLDDDGEFDDASESQVTTSFPDDGVNTVGLLVYDSFGGYDVDTLTITVLNVAPNISDITGALEPKPLGTAVTLSAAFTDPGVDDTHSALWDWGDGTSSAGTVSGLTAQGTHTYTSTGVYSVALTITDDDGGTTSAMYEYIVIYDPSGGFATGGGWITSPEGAYLYDPSLTGKASFGFVAKYQKGMTIPTGTTQFVFSIADFNFESTAYEWLVIAGTKAQYKGNGMINGTGSYRFILTAIDGIPDRFRIKIWDPATGEVIYDNQRGEADNASTATALGGGSITIHKQK